LTGNILQTKPNIVLTSDISEAATGRILATQRVSGGTGEDMAYSLIQTDDGGYALVGRYTSSGSNWDAWLIKLVYEKASAMIHLDPSTLNLESKGKWITAYVELPEGYNVADINVSTIMLNDTVPAELRPTAIGDYDGDGVPDLMVKFDRAAVVQYILDHLPAEGRFLTVTLTITGKLNDGTPFQGSDTIKTILNIPSTMCHGRASPTP
jgi:hypothetical protein